MYKRPNLWTDTETALLVELVDVYPPLSCTEIGARIGKTKNAIIGKMHRMREKGAFRHIAPTPKMMIDSKWDRADIAFLKNYIAKGFKSSNIARMMRRTKHEVEAKIKQLG